MKKSKLTQTICIIAITITCFASTNSPTLFAGAFLPKECKSISSSQKKILINASIKIVTKSNAFRNLASKLPKTTRFAFLLQNIVFKQSSTCTLQVTAYIDEISYLHLWNNFKVDANRKVYIIKPEY
ncbi:hypothetical protein [Aquitalea sp. ASV11]|uniref:hypothetical protein n=1 Tax=Aquitalea sp. ASV11 TaxID=2795103 RepID=UPI0018EBD2EA|nr:hypothetical protein [Aquitalea sp. ASV11]